MDFELSDEQRQLADSLERLLAQQYDIEQRRAIIASADGFSAAMWARFAELEAGVRRRLTEIGRPELIEVMELNIFGASLDPGLPDDVVADLDEMLRLGEEVSVFLAPAGSTS